MLRTVGDLLDFYDTVSGGQPVSKKVREASEAYAAALLNRTLLGYLRGPVDWCGSPIESLFMQAFIAACFDLGVVVFPPSGKPEVVFGDASIGPPEFEVRPQHTLARHRVDFFVSFRGASVVVECDGHDFHEKTKRQAAADKSRDRAVLSAGFSTMRFAGSELWADALGCAEAVSGQLLAMYQKQCKAVE